MRKTLIVLILGMGLLLTGCFQSHRVITVNKDGSGTIVETFMLSTNLGKMPGGEDGHDPEKLKADAVKYGENVTYVSSEAITENSLVGYEVTYSFPDIEKLTISEDATEEMMNMGMGNSDPKHLQFKFQKGSKAKLEIIFPHEDMEETEMPEDTAWEGEEIEEISEEEQQQVMQMAQALYVDMAVSTKIVVNGSITDSDADHKNGNEITLQEIKFSEFMKDSKFAVKMKKMEEMEPDQIESVMKDFPGVKIETKDKVTINFK